MIKNFKCLLCLFLFAFMFSICLDVAALSDIHIGVAELNPGIKVCTQSSIFSDKAYIYAWKNESSISGWPGEEMNKNEEGYYCYTVQQNKTFTDIVFNNNFNAQTIDLSTIKDDGNLINDYLYIFNNMYDGKYIGEWYVYDKSGLTTLVSSSTSKINNRLKYTKPTYNTFKNEYNISNGIIDFPNPYSTINSPLVVERDDISGSSVYSSSYIDAYNRLYNSIEELKERAPIVVNEDIITGVVSAKYVDEENSDNYEIEIDAEAIDGYKLNGVRAYKITGFDDGEPILGDELSVSENDGKFYAEYTEFDNQNLKGIYVDASFSKKVYKISFTIDKNGKVVYVKDGSEFDIYDVVEVEHGDNFLAKIIANEGYTLKSATVNGNLVDIIDNYLRIDNVGSDQNVEISFTLKTYTVSIDNVNYVFPYGTTYDELIKKIDTNKEGYTFVGLVDKNRNKISKDYIVKGNDTLYTLYRDDSNIINPDTGVNILKVIVLFMFIIVLLYVNGKNIERNKKKKSK